MSLSREVECPDCGVQRFYRAASTRLRLGVKKKWHCPNCEYGFVTVDGIDTRS